MFHSAINHISVCPFDYPANRMYGCIFKIQCKGIYKNPPVSQSFTRWQGLALIWQGLALRPVPTFLIILSTFAAYFKQQFIAMQKSGYISELETGKTGCKVNIANMKVSRANAQSRPSGILLSPDNGKLYFEAFGINSMLQNNLPLQGEKRSEVAFPSKNSHH
jgi:hypothetical protein